MGDYSGDNINKYMCRHPFVEKRLKRFFQAVAGMMARLESKRVLSLGCGECLDLRRLCDISSFEVDRFYGLDMNADALRMSVSVMDGIPFTPIHGDVMHMTLQLSQFDLILCLELLEHLPNPRGLLEKISRDYTGHCILSVPNEPLFRLARMILFQKNIRDFGNHPDHINHWSSYSFQRLLKEYFTIDRVEKPFPWTVVLCRVGK